MEGSSQIKPTEGAERIHSACDLRRVSCWRPRGEPGANSGGKKEPHGVRSSIQDPHQVLKSFTLLLPSAQGESVYHSERRLRNSQRLDK